MLGFKVFRLAKPNIEQWVPEADRDPETYAKKLGLFDDPLVAGWTPDNVLWEVALREGFSLNAKFEKKMPTDGITIYEVTDPDKDPPQTLAVCLDEEVRVDLSKHYPLSADTLFICRDSRRSMDTGRRQPGPSVPAEDHLGRGRPMRFQFDGNQAFQLRAIEAVADLFRGQPRVTPDFSTFEFGEVFSPVNNRLDLAEDQMLANLHAVQKRLGIPEDERLETIEETIRTARGNESARFLNFSVEMETGTGKTYVYLRTALELHRRYGMRKFIVVVPSVAVREGVLKSLKITQQHLRAIYDNVPYRFTTYDSKSIGKVRQFAQSDCVEILVMTIDSFNKDDNVIRQSTDRLQGATPLYLVQSARPVLILDEPQNMESEGRIKALASLHPLVALRYSATHRNPYNLVYRLTPFEAYRQGLVKRIEVDSVRKEDDYNQVFLRLEEIRTAKKTIQARIAIHQRMANGSQIKEKAYLFKPGDCLQR